MRIHINQVDFTKWLIRRSLAALAVVAMVTFCGLVVALGAYASSHRAGHKRLSVFSHPLKRRGHAAYTDARKLPPSAVLAKMFGNDEVYVSEEAGITCLMVVEPTGSVSGCGKSATVQEVGMLLVSAGPGPVRVGLLAPNGVTSMTLFDRGGSSQHIKVTNNVAETYDSNVESVQYELPNGSTRTEKIPYGVLHPTP
jgi:hypothetical protein